MSSSAGVSSLRRSAVVSIRRSGLSNTLKHNLERLQESLADVSMLENMVSSLSEENDRLHRLLGREARNPNQQFEFKVNDKVQYFTRNDTWIDACVLGINKDTGTYVLDVQAHALPQKVRRANHHSLTTQMRRQKKDSEYSEMSNGVEIGAQSEELVGRMFGGPDAPQGGGEMSMEVGGRSTAVSFWSATPESSARSDLEPAPDKCKSSANLRQPLDDDLECCEEGPDVSGLACQISGGSVEVQTSPRAPKASNALERSATKGQERLGPSLRETSKKFIKDGGSMILLDMGPLSSELSKKFSMESSAKRSIKVLEYRMWPTWTKYDSANSSGMEVVHSASLQSSGFHRSSSLTQTGASDQKFQRFLDALEDQKGQNSCVISPLSLYCVIWDFLFMVLILYDFIMVPIDQAFHPPHTLFLRFMSWLTRIFWTMSLPFNFFVGFIHPDGTVEERQSKVVWRYVTTWFLFDILVVSSDWLEVILISVDIGSIAFVRTLRILRVVRVLRMIRVCKLPAVLETLSTRSYFETARLVMNLLKIFAAYMGLVHCLACLWFAIGKDKWWTLFTSADAGLSYKYALSLHWAMSQILGSSDIYPQTEGQRLFAAAAQAVCFFVSALFVSEITASLTRLSIISGHLGRQFAILRQYLDYNNITYNLAVRVTRCARYQSNLQERNMPECDVELLSLISSPLLGEIHYEVRISVLTSHPFFRRYHHVCQFAVRKLCHEATDVSNISPGDLLFAEGERAGIPRMFFLTGGTMLYMKSGIEEVGASSIGSWACEMACWVPWLHLGDFRAATHVHLLYMDVNKFQQIACEFREPVFYPANYAKLLVTAVNAQNQASCLEISQSADHAAAELECDDINYGNVSVTAIVNKVFPHHLSRSESGRSSISSLGSSSIADMADKVTGAVKGAVTRISVHSMDSSQSCQSSSSPPE